MVVHPDTINREECHDSYFVVRPTSSRENVLDCFLAADGGPLSATWNVIPTTAAGWKEQVDAGYAATMKGLPALRETLRVKVEPMTIEGVKAYMVTPEVIPPENQNRLLVHVHGGCFVSFPGESGTVEAVYMAGFGHFKVLSVDYRDRKSTRLNSSHPRLSRMPSSA